ncbi:MAG: cbb3-type cytochrome c oxidase subunit I [Candidatus Hydrogenedentes bacterium]|nr:cbb3-type cytochrome c oxidase subunit I [Candidatus Hydrogenedentota bacterium]
MAQTADFPERDYERPAVHYLNWQQTVSSWLLSVDHKRIGILYLISISIFFLVGGAFASIFRIELLTPEGDLLQADTYNKFFTLHGVVMIFFFLIPSIPAVLGNFLIPLQIGAKDVAFPKLNLLSWYIFMTGGTLGVIIIVMGGLDTGWTFYTPLSSSYANTHVFLAALLVFITGFSSILTGLNFLVTIHKMRAPGLTWFRLPLFIWAQYATSVIQILGTPVLAITVFLVGVERIWGVGIFDPALGGDPVLFQHMFWFYSHPAVYIMILPGMGVISEIIACFSRNRVFGYEFIAFSSVAIAIIGFLVWGHHMYVSGQAMYSSLVFSLLTMLVAVPSAIKIFNWTATLYKGNVVWATPMLYAIGFIGLFAIGGGTGLFLGATGMDVPLHDTYFVVAHFHYVMVGGMVMAYLAGLHFYWPKMTGKMYPQIPASLCAVLVFVGFNCTFFPQFLLGWLGMPRRYHSYHPDFQVLNILSTAGASILGLGFIIPGFYFAWSLFFGKDCGSNPWGARGLEWEVCTSPPDAHNFHETPVVTQEAYAYTGEETLSV